MSVVHLRYIVGGTCRVRKEESPRGYIGSFLGCPTKPPSIITEDHFCDWEVRLQGPTIMQGQESMGADGAKGIVGSSGKGAALGPAFSSGKWGREAPSGPQHHLLTAIEGFSPTTKIAQGWPVRGKTCNVMPDGHVKSTRFITVDYVRFS
jgi:hypothetical protein